MRLRRIIWYGEIVVWRRGETMGNRNKEKIKMEEAQAYEKGGTGKVMGVKGRRGNEEMGRGERNSKRRGRRKRGSEWEREIRRGLM